MSSTYSENIINQVKNLQPDLAEKLLQREGYNQILNLVSRYEEYPPEERARISEVDLSRRFVSPLFKALGWSVAADQTIGQHPMIGDKVQSLGGINIEPNAMIGDQVQSSGGIRTEPTKVDLFISYEELQVPVEVKKYLEPFGRDPNVQAQFFQLVRKASGSFGILTNFESIHLWDFRDPSNPLQVLSTSPRNYLLDIDESQNFLAAPVFYQRFVKQLNQLDRIPERQEPRFATRFLSDQPGKIDQLKFSPYADAIADFIQDEKTEKPLTIAIDAAWGMGKTTLMQMIQARLSIGRQVKWKWWLPTTWFKGEHFPIVWFNAWKYDKEESLWAALTLEILYQIQKQHSTWRRGWVWLQLNWERMDRGALLRSILKSLVSGFVVALLGALVFAIALLWFEPDLGNAYMTLLKSVSAIGGLGFLGFLVAVGKEAYERIGNVFDLKVSRYVREPNYEERIGFIAEFENDFEKVVKIVTRRGKWPLVVFIDDLDRCEPPKSAEIVEAINLLLDTKYCVFVIGMDSQMVVASLEAKYKELKNYLSDLDDPGGLTLGQRFLEKIVQITFHIPRVEEKVLEAFIDENLNLILEKKQVPQTEQKVAEQLIKAEQRAGLSLDDAVKVVQESRPDIKPTEVEAAKKEVDRKSQMSDAVRSACLTVAPHYLSSNPRKIKRFINQMFLMAFIADRRGLLDENVIASDLILLAKVAVMTTRWPDIVQTLLTDKKLMTNLKSAIDMRDTLLKIQSSTRPKGPADETEEEGFRAALDNFLADPRIKRLIDATDLIMLLNSMNESEIAVLPKYYYLAQTTVQSTVDTKQGTAG